MPQVDRDIRIYRIAALLTISHSRTVPIYSRGEVNRIYFLRMMTVVAKDTDSATTVKAIVASITNVYRPLAWTNENFIITNFLSAWGGYPLISCDVLLTWFNKALLEFYKERMKRWAQYRQVAEPDVTHTLRLDRGDLGLKLRVIFR